tara:strand:- start:370 stop:870 length:501 start_codon:yes stop_codon:yes gene_type:complete
MSSKIFYKALATISTIGVVVIAGIQVKTVLNKANTTQEQLAKTMVLIKNARVDALDEVKTTKADLLEELNNIRTSTLNEIKYNRASASYEVKAAKNEALQSLRNESEKKREGSVWLVMLYEGINGPALEKVEMVNMTECESQGAVWQTSTSMNPNEWQGFQCIEGK